MAVMQMQRVSICALTKHRKKIMEELQRLGWMQVDEEMDPDGEFSRMDTGDIRSVSSKNVAQVEKALEIIDLYAPREKGAFSSMNGKPVLDVDIYEAGADGYGELISATEKIIDLDRDIMALNANIVKLKNQIDEITPWMELDVPMNQAGTKTTEFFIGTISGNMSEHDIESALKEKAPELDLYSITKVYSTQDMTFVAVVVSNKEARPLEESLRHIGFSKPSNLFGEVPSVAKTNIEKEIADSEKEIEGLKGNIAALADKYEDLRMFADYNRIRAKKYEVIETLPATRNVFALEGFVPKECVLDLTNKLTEQFDAIVESRDLTDEEEAPVLFKNRWFASVGEGTVESFGLPNKSEIDPSFIMMIFYVIFFGLMLSDAAYGAVLSLGTGIMLLKFPNMEKGMKKLISLFFLCGFSTLFWGVLFGGYFGDVIDVVARTFLGVDLPAGSNIIPPVWFAPLNNPMQMLIYSLLFGLIHMYVGLFLAAYQNIKNKQVTSLITTVCTGMFVLGLVLILLPTDLFEGIAQMEFNFPPAFQTFTKVMALVGLIGIILFASAETKNPGLRLLLGLYEVYNDITGWLSDTLSYSRLLALGLATGVIAQVVNQMGSMFGGGVLGAILFIVIFIIGHVFNLAINVLGAYVHTCRLQYVEFFGKFYEGGGKKFRPFFADTKYVEIKGGK